MKKIAFITQGIGNQAGSEMTDAHYASVSLSELSVQIVFFKFDQEFNSQDFDALIIPGGSDLLENMTTYTTDGIRFKLNSVLENTILKFYQQSKPIGSIGISSLVTAQALKKFKPLITLGETSDLISNLTKMNIQHETCPSDDYITDRDCKLLSTPAYLNQGLSSHSVLTGVRLMIRELVEMA